MSTERYSVEVARLILAPVCGEYLSFDEAGVWIKADVLDSSYAHDVLRWTPACEMDWIGSPDPLASPALPQNFTSKDFAALMLDGVVAQLEEVYGDFQNAPDSEALDGLGMRGGKAKQLLREAYTEFRNAMGRVGAPNAALTAKAEKLQKEYRRKRGDALQRERVMEENSLGLPDSEYQEEYRRRRARAVEPLAELELEMKRVTAEADVAWRAWVKAMVSDLLGPVAVVIASHKQPAPLVRDVVAGKAVNQATDGAGLPLTKSALIRQHRHHWPTIEGDIKGAKKNGLSAAALANNKRGWIESKALAWSRSKNKLHGADSPETALANAMHSMSLLPSRQNRI